MSNEDFFFGGMFLLPPDSLLGAYLMEQETPESSEKKHWAPLYRYNPTSWFGTPTRFLSEFSLKAKRDEAVPVLVRFSALPQREDAERVEKFPNYVRVWIKRAIPEYPLEKYVQVFSDSLEAVQNIYPDVVPIHPQTPQEPVGSLWLGITRVAQIDRQLIGRENAVVLARRKDADVYGEEAVVRANRLLLEVAAHSGWEVTKDSVRKIVMGTEKFWHVKISRTDLAVTMDPSKEPDDWPERWDNLHFRCITSTPAIPKDDQAIQKIHAFDVPEPCARVNTIRDFYNDVFGADENEMKVVQ